MSSEYSVDALEMDIKKHNIQKRVSDLLSEYHLTLKEFFYTENELDDSLKIESLEKCNKLLSSIIANNMIVVKLQWDIAKKALKDAFTDDIKKMLADE